MLLKYNTTELLTMCSRLALRKFNDMRQIMFPDRVHAHVISESFIFGPSDPMLNAGGP